MKRYTLSIRAERDLNEIVVYLAEHAGPNTARRIMADLKSAMRFLASHLAAGHFRNDLTEHPYRFWTVYSYLVVYDSAKRPIEVLRVLHTAQDATRLL